MLGSASDAILFVLPGTEAACPCRRGSRAGGTGRGHVFPRGSRPSGASREQLNGISGPRVPPARPQPGREQAFGLREREARQYQQKRAQEHSAMWASGRSKCDAVAGGNVHSVVSAVTSQYIPSPLGGILGKAPSRSCLHTSRGRELTSP